MSSSDWWIILSTAPLILSEDERWVVSWGSDGNTAVGKRARVCMKMLIPLKRNAPTLGSCISAQMAPSRKATLVKFKGTSKHWWFFRGPASFSGPSQTYKDYSCVHNTGCHTYTLWINWYFFHLVKGKRQGWSNVGVVVTVRRFPPLHVFSFRVRQRSCCCRYSSGLRSDSESFSTETLAPPCWRTAFTVGDRQSGSIRKSIYTFITFLYIQHWISCNFF